MLLLLFFSPHSVVYWFRRVLLRDLPKINWWGRILNSLHLVFKVNLIISSTFFVAINTVAHIPFRLLSFIPHFVFFLSFLHIFPSCLLVCFLSSFVSFLPIVLPSFVTLFFFLFSLFLPLFPSFWNCICDIHCLRMMRVFCCIHSQKVSFIKQYEADTVSTFSPTYKTPGNWLYTRLKCVSRVVRKTVLKTFLLHT